MRLPDIQESLEWGLSEGVQQLHIATDVIACIPILYEHHPSYLGLLAQRATSALPGNDNGLRTHSLSNNRNIGHSVVEISSSCLFDSNTRKPKFPGKFQGLCKDFPSRFRGIGPRICGVRQASSHQRRRGTG
jgi:hypothetical protein